MWQELHNEVLYGVWLTKNK